MNRHHLSVNCSPTYKQLAVELQMNVSVSGGFLNGAGMMVHIQWGLLHVPLSSHVMPALVVQSRRRLHLHLQRPVPHVKREEHLSRGWKHKHIWWMFRLISGWWLIRRNCWREMRHETRSSEICCVADDVWCFEKTPGERLKQLLMMMKWMRKQLTDPFSCSKREKSIMLMNSIIYRAKNPQQRENSHQISLRS